MLQHHQDMQEKLAEEMLSLARSLKNNTLAAQNVIKQDNQVVHVELWPLKFCNPQVLMSEILQLDSRWDQGGGNTCLQLNLFSVGGSCQSWQL